MQVPNRIIAMQTRLAAMSGEVSLLEADLARLIADRIATVKRQQTLANLPADPVEQIWCADLTEDLTGEVGTIEIPGEGSTKVIVAPGYEGAAAFEDRFGWLAHREGQRADQLYFNAALLPGWQKFQPTHRIGTISAATSGGTFSVQLDPAVSSAAGLNINQSSSLQGVPARYMQCDADAFETGDRVVVQFNDQDWTKPVIIGFEANPKACATDVYVFNPESNNLRVRRYTAKSQFEQFVQMPIAFQESGANQMFRVFRGHVITLFDRGLDACLFIDGEPAPWQPTLFFPTMPPPLMTMCTHPTGIWVIQRAITDNVFTCTRIQWDGFVPDKQWTFHISEPWWLLYGAWVRGVVASSDRLYFSLSFGAFSIFPDQTYLRTFSNDGEIIESSNSYERINLTVYQANHGDVVGMIQSDYSRFGELLESRFVIKNMKTGVVERQIIREIDEDGALPAVMALTSEMIVFLANYDLSRKIIIVDRSTGARLTAVSVPSESFNYNQITVDGRLNALSL